MVPRETPPTTGSIPTSSPRVAWRWQRYDLRITARTWHLTDVRGNSHAILYRYGVSIQEAVEKHYASCHRVAPWAADDSVLTFKGLFVTVVPAEGGSAI